MIIHIVQLYFHNVSLVNRCSIRHKIRVTQGVLNALYYRREQIFEKLEIDA